MVFDSVKRCTLNTAHVSNATRSRRVMLAVHTVGVRSHRRMCSSESNTRMTASWTTALVRRTLCAARSPNRAPGSVLRWGSRFADATYMLRDGTRTGSTSRARHRAHSPVFSREGNRLTDAFAAAEPDAATNAHVPSDAARQQPAHARG
jgi:hypothetical protein